MNTDEVKQSVKTVDVALTLNDGSIHRGFGPNVADAFTSAVNAAVASYDRPLEVQANQEVAVAGEETVKPEFNVGEEVSHETSDPTDPVVSGEEPQDAEEVQGLGDPRVENPEENEGQPNVA